MPRQWVTRQRGRSVRLERIVAKSARVIAPEPANYRDLQAQAKELGIPANQSKDDLEAAIEEQSDGS